MYILSHSCDLENQKNYEIIITQTENLITLVRAENFICQRRYHIEYKNSHREVVCPEYALDDGSTIVIIPWFLIPGRPYPIQIYLFACDLYSSNSSIGQRGAAKATRDEFKLEQFSHSTVCRSIKKLNQLQKQALERNFGEEYQPKHEEYQVPENESKSAKVQEISQIARRFPSLEDTSKIRASLLTFLKIYHNAAKKNIETASQLFVEHWYLKTVQLLL